MATTNYAVPPGAFLEEWLDDEAMTQGEAAARLGCSRKQINEIVNGRAPVTADTASRLARLTSVPTDAWLRYEALYRADLARIRDEETLAQYVDAIHPGAASYLREVGATRATRRRPGELVSDFLAFHRCGTWEAYEQLQHTESSGDYALAALTESRADLDPTLLSTWVRAGELDERFELGRRGDYDERELRALLPELRERTARPDQKLLADVGQILRRAGVVFMLISPPRGLPLYGVTRWIDKQVPIIQQSGRRQHDGFVIWTLFHEIGHVLNDPRGELHVEYSTKKMRTSVAERSANQFALDTLFGPEGLAPFSDLRYDREIRDTAARIGVAPGVAVQQMHRNRILDYSRGNRLFVDVGTAE
ncbi:HigA family addiction module antitoxin [Georgenia subflava]|uniref:HigA family addiction module antidote protein n=1 Tax=Georgenia subflava TaxID=1622177 RepID=A0A6N7EM18_9MICO|nr:HigA family addiction module antitoxin [Georgenia subflava]MPV36294.1 HigA family addiction module antidote protein [Georgenia subflava]